MIKYFVLVFIGLSYFATYGQTPYRDKSHQSKVFGKEKAYRIYLPESYRQAGKKYPVIYFFHGWGGRHFKDPSAKLDYEKIGELVDKYQFILVMWDGKMDEAEQRPYNVGDHHDVKFNVQMKNYFPELVAHIDSSYRTFTDRNHRGIIGFSMGGFMSFYIAGKYPDMVSAAVNFVGSPDFFIGLPENHTHYPIKYTFGNLEDVGLLFHNRTNCPMSGLNDEVHQGALWAGLENYEYHKLEGEHQIDDPGETKIFESAVRFVMDQFHHPKPLGKRWSHYDLCQQFEIWDYSVKSNKSEPGFLFLKNVDDSGFGFYTKKWLPDGPAIKACQAIVSTAPIYEPGNDYDIRIFNLKESKLEEISIRADDEGRLNFNLSGEGFEVGISKKTAKPEFTALKYSLSSKGKYLRMNQEEKLTLDIFNRAGTIDPDKKLTLRLSSADTSVNISLPEQEIVLSGNENSIGTGPFKIFSTKNPPTDGSPAWIQLNVEMNYDSFQFNDWLLLPVFYDVPEFTNIQVDDGRAVPPALNPGDSEKTNKSSVYGFGNGDGMVSAGERIILYENGHRLRLYSNDPYVLADEEVLVDEMLPGKWPDGYTLSSIVKIAEDCPLGHEIEFQAHYETKTHMPIYRHVKRGKVKIEVKKVKLMKRNLIVLMAVLFSLPALATVEEKPVWSHVAGQFGFQWDIENDQAITLKQPGGQTIWEGSLLPAFLLEDETRKQHYIKATADINQVQVQDEYFKFLLKFDEFGAGELLVKKTDWGVSFEKLSIDGDKPFTDWKWENGKLTIRINEVALSKTAGFRINRTN